MWGRFHRSDLKMPDYNVILAGRYGVGKSSLFYRLREGQPPESAREGSSSRDTRTWGEDEGVDCFVYKREIEGRDVKVSWWVRISYCSSDQ